MKKALFAALCSVALVSWATANAAGHECRHVGSDCGETAYLSGGVGEEERAQMQAEEKNFDLKLVFVEKKTGAYLGDVELAITDASGSKLIEVITDGPIFLVQLPSGKYSIEASSNGKVQRRNIRINAKKRAALTFFWNPD